MVDRAKLDELKARVPLSSLVGRVVTFDRARSMPQRGDYWALCPFHKEHSPSFHVLDAKGFYKCFGCGATGDHISFIQEQMGARDFGAAVDILAEMAGELPAAPLAETAPRHAKPEKSGLAKARKIWCAAERDLPVLWHYLRARGVDMRALGAIPESLRVHPALEYWAKDATTGRLIVAHRGPAMVARISANIDTPAVGVHRTWISATGRARRQGVKLDKRWLGATGHIYGEPVVLGPSGGSRMIVGEGIETVLATYSHLLAAGEVWRAEAALSRDALAGRPAPEAAAAARAAGARLDRIAEPDRAGGGWTCPDDVEDLVILGEGSAKDPETARRLTMRAAERHRFRSDGTPRRVRIALPGGDWAASVDFADVAADVVARGGGDEEGN